MNVPYGPSNMCANFPVCRDQVPYARLSPVSSRTGHLTCVTNFPLCHYSVPYVPFKFMTFSALLFIFIPRPRLTSFIILLEASCSPYCFLFIATLIHYRRLYKLCLLLFHFLVPYNLFSWALVHHYPRSRSVLQSDVHSCSFCQPPLFTISLVFLFC